MPTPYPPEFRRDVIAVARQGDHPGSRSLGVSGSPRPAWPAGFGSLTTKTPSPTPPMPPTTARCRSRTGSCESVPSSWSRRTRSCAERPPTSPARPSQNDVPAGRRPGRRQDPCRGDLPGARVLQASLLPVVRQSRQLTRLGRRPPHQRRDRHPPRRPRVRLPVHHRRARRRRDHRQPQPRQPAVHPTAPVQPPRPQTWPAPHARATRPRRPRRPAMHRRSTGPVVADRHHRAPDHRWQAVSVRDHRRLHQPDRRVLDGRTHDRPPRR